MKKYMSKLMAIGVIFLCLGASAVASAKQPTNPGVQANQVQKYTLLNPAVKGSTGSNVLVSNSVGDDIIPGITKDASGNTVVTWTNEQDSLTWNMGIAYSSTPSTPDSWTGWTITLTATTMVYSSDTAYVTGPSGLWSGLYGVQMYYDTNYLGFYQIDDITTDPSTWSYNYWNQAIDGPTYATVEDQGYYHEPYYDSHGPVNMYIYHEVYSTYDIPDCPTYLIYDIANSSSLTFFDGQSHLWTAPAKDPAMAMLPNEFHLAWQYHNATTDTNQIVWKRVNSSVEADIEFTPYQQYVAVGTNPEIAAFQQGSAIDVAIVYVDGGVVKCVYSSDDGSTWSSPVTVATGSYPALCAVGNKLYCAYIDQGNLFLVTSDDGGATWSTAEQINDQAGTVSAEENAVDIHSAGIVWVDTRGADKDIYYAALPGGQTNNPPTAPTINGPASGKAKQSYNYTFLSTDPDGDNVFYFIDWGDNSTSGWLGPYASGAGITVAHTWAKKGSYVVKAQAKDVFGNVGNWSTLQISMPLSYEPTHPFFSWLFGRFPHAFPILRYLLGF
jgi:PKD domain